MAKKMSPGEALNKAMELSPKFYNSLYKGKPRDTYIRESRVLGKDWKFRLGIGDKVLVYEHNVGNFVETTITRLVMFDEAITVYSTNEENGVRYRSKHEFRKEPK